MDSEENVLSLKQYHDIISLAEWDEIEKVNIDKTGYNPIIISNIFGRQ